MAFTSLKYIIFFTMCCLIYFVLNKKLKIVWLLICSYYFYMSWNPKYALLMLFSTFVTYLSGILIHKAKNIKQKKLYVLLSVLINFAILILFKYYTFLIEAISPLLDAISLSIPSSLNLLLPVGISFYTFQALSYTIDVYRGDVKVEKNFIKYALFVSFFPQLVAGPIEKSKDLLGQFSDEHVFNWDNLHQGLLVIVVGFFYKLVISDRAAIAVNAVYNNLGDFTPNGGFFLITATVLFAIQIYFDFKAYSTIARGSAQVMGYTLSQNFNMPYFATSIKDFWRRWHISLSSWFKEYLYFPLGGSKKGFWKTQMNTMIVFLVSGLWHGASWTFIIWGALHGLYQVIGNIFKKFVKVKEIHFVGYKLVKVIVTFILVDFAWIFFRANSLSDALLVIRNLFSFGMVKDFSLLGYTYMELILLGISVFVVFGLEFLSIKKDLYQFLKKRNIVIRWGFYYILLFVIIIFGIYGPGFDAQEFIYFQF